ncbi:MAG: response regulator [Candidatus Promineifilaceae bacterium]|jgi:DNA-binding NarL/FixJ family response regulator
MSIRLLIADDHEVVRRGLVLLLRQENDLDVVGEARDGSEAVTMAIELQPDVVLIDWKMPRQDGLSAAREIKEYVPTARCLMLSGAALDTAVFDALDQGIDGFVNKDVSPSELVLAIRTVAQGKNYLGPEISRGLIERSRRPSKSASGERPSLSAREQEVLQLMATPLTYREIGRQLHIGEETVRTYAKRILAKLDQPNRTQAVVAGLRYGLIKLE